MLHPAPGIRHRGRDLGEVVSFGQKPDRLKVPCRGHIRARPVLLLQSRNAQMIRHMRHGSSPRLMALQPIRVPDPGESPADSISRSSYYTPVSMGAAGRRCIRTINSAIGPDDLVASSVGPLTHAQPGCPPDFLKTLPPAQTPIRGLQIPDTCFYYPEDRGIAESVRLGQEMARAA